MPKKISKSDEQKISKLFAEGKDLQAEDYFVSKYITEPARKISGFVSKVASSVENRIMSTQKMNQLTITVSTTLSAYDVQVRSYYTQYANLFSKYLFEKFNITKPFVKNTIKRASLAQFNSSVKDALSQTNSNLLNSIRKYQTDLIKANQKIDAAVDAGRLIGKEVLKAQEIALQQAAKLNPSIARFKDGNFVVYRDGSLHSMESYTDMATRTTLLNVDRTAVEVKSGASGRRLVEYYKRDDRSVREKRSVCDSIMKTKIKGVSMVALDQGAADIFGIRTLEQAKLEDGKAFGPNCRHSIRPLSDVIYNELEKVLFVAETEVA